MTLNYHPFHKMKLKIKQELTGLKIFSFNLIYSKILITSKSHNMEVANITKNDLIENICISLSKIDKDIKSKKLSYVKIGRAVRFRRTGYRELYYAIYISNTINNLSVIHSTNTLNLFCS